MSTTNGDFQGEHIKIKFVFLYNIINTVTESRTGIVIPVCDCVT